MVILHAGVPRSGNLWLHRILQSIARHTGVEPRSFIRGHPNHERFRRLVRGFSDEADVDFLHIGPRHSSFWLSSVLNERIHDFDEYLRATSLVWTHSDFCDRSRVVLAKFDKVIYLIRDPRDQAVSLSRYAFTPGMRWSNPRYERSPDSLLANDLDGLLRSWVFHVAGYLKFRDELRIHVMFNERLLYDEVFELRRLLEYLGVEANDALVDQVRRDVSFCAMKARDPDHVRQGTSGQWRAVFTAAQKRHADRVAGGMMQLLGYPLADDAGGVLPRVTPGTSQKELEEAATAARRTIGDELARVRTFLIGDRPLRAKVQRVKNWVRYSRG
jgi:aryl sulfotransferase